MARYTFEFAAGLAAMISTHGYFYIGRIGELNPDGETRAWEESSAGAVGEIGIYYNDDFDDIDGNLNDPEWRKQIKNNLLAFWESHSAEDHAERLHNVDPWDQNLIRDYAEQFDEREQDE